MSDQNSDFITLLAKRANLDQEKAEKQLTSLVDTIQSEVKEKGSYEIDKFGTFSLVDNQLTFSPHKQLEIEVNYKYAGMTPIQIRPAYVQKTKEASEETQKEEKKQQSAIDRLSQLASESRKEKPADQKSEPAKPVAKSEEKKPDDSPKQPEPTQKADTVKKSEAPTPPKKEAEKPAPKKEVPKPTQPEKKKTTLSDSKPAEKKAAQEKPEESKKNPLLIPIGIAATVLLAILVFWLIQSGGPQAPETEVAQTETQPAPPVTTEETVTEPTPPPEEVSVPDPVISTQPYGLRGELSETTNYFTIVVMSLRSESSAINEKNSLISEGWRATLHSVITAEGTNNYRVGIGQFESISAAQQAARDLPEPYRSNNFISRVR